MPPNPLIADSILFPKQAMQRDKASLDPDGVFVTYLLYVAAALAEIAGCFAFWTWPKRDRSLFWLMPGIAMPGAVCLAGASMILLAPRTA